MKKWVCSVAPFNGAHGKLCKEIIETSFCKYQCRIVDYLKRVDNYVACYNGVLGLYKQTMSASTAHNTAISNCKNGPSSTDRVVPDSLSLIKLF